MLERPRFKFYLKADETNWYKVINNAVISDASKVPLAFDPVDWAETDISYLRHETYRGVMRSYTAPVTFCEDGAYIIRSTFYTKGYNGRIIFEAEILDEGNNSQHYVNAYSGEVDFSSVANDEQNTFQTAVLDRGLIAMIKTGQKVPQTIQLLDADCHTVLMDGIRLQNKSNFTALALMRAEKTVDASQFSPELSHIVSEAAFTGDIKNRALDTGEINDIMNNSWFYEASIAGNVTVTFSGEIAATIRGLGTTVPDPRFRIMLVVNNAGVRTDHDMYTEQLFGNIGGYLVAFGPTYVNVPPPLTTTIFMQPGERLSFIIGFEPFDEPSAAVNRWHFDVTRGTLKIQYDLRNDPTFARCYRQIEVWRKVVQGITGSTQYGVVSDYLTDATLSDWGNTPWNTMMTSGDGARHLGTGQLVGAAEMKVDLSTLFDDLNNRCNIGLGIEGDNVRIEPLSYFFDKNLVALKLGLVTDFNVTVAQELLCSAINIGYQYEANEILNGKNDPFTTFVYAVPVRYVDKTLEWVSPFIASIYKWEDIRIVFAEKSTTDNKLDSKILLVEVNGLPDVDNRFSVRRHSIEPGGDISGLLAGDTAYNLALLPEYNLRRKSALVHTIMHMMTDPLIFKQADQNKDVVSKLSDFYPEVVASDHLMPEDLDEMIYPPLLFNFNYPAPPEFDNLLMGGRNALIEFDVLNKKMNKVITLRGFLEKASVIQGRNEGSEWLLRPAPDTDFSQLIW